MGKKEIRAVFAEMRKYGDPASIKYVMPFRWGDLRKRGIDHSTAVAIRQIFTSNRYDIRELVINEVTSPHQGYHCIKKNKACKPSSKKSELKQDDDGIVVVYDDDEFEQYEKNMKKHVAEIDNIQIACSKIHHYNNCECGQEWFSRSFAKPKVCPFCAKKIKGD